MHVYPIYRKLHGYVSPGNEHVSLISKVILRGKTSPTGLSPEEATALAEMFHNVPLLLQPSFQCLTPLVVRSYPNPKILPWITILIHAPDFWPMPCSVNRVSSLAWNCHWGQGSLETGGNISGTLKGQEPFTCHVSAQHISGTCVMSLAHFPYM